MRILDFSILFFVTPIFGKPAINYRGIALPDYAVRMKKHNDDWSKGYLEQCGIVEFPNAQRGFVNVLAFLDSSWPYSHRQAIMLKMLNERLIKSGLSDTHFFVVNIDPVSSTRMEDTEDDDIEREAWLGVSPEEIEDMSKINKTLDSMARSMFPDIRIIQDSEELGIWKKFGGSRDQVLVIDRCGKLAYQVIVPWSILHFPYVKAAVLSTYKDEPCGYCVIADVTTTSRYESDDLLLETSLKIDTYENNNNNKIVNTSDIAEQDSVAMFTKQENNVDKQSIVDEYDNESTTGQPSDTMSESTSMLNFFSTTDTTIAPDSTTRNLIAEHNDDLTTWPGTKNYETTLSTIVIVETNVLGLKEDTSFTEVTSEFSEELKMATTTLDSIDLNSEDDEITTSLSTIDNIIDSTTEDMLNVETTGIQDFDEDNVASKMADPTIVGYTDFNDHTTNDNEHIVTTNNDLFTTTTGTFDDNSETTTKDFSSLSRLEYDKNEDTKDITNLPSEDETYDSLSYMPIRIIMHAPHFHTDIDSTRMHEYVVLKTGSSMKHGHLGSVDATRLYSEAQDRNEEASNFTIRDIETREWPMKNLIYNRDESTGLFGEVADYWRDIGSIENYEDTDETERPVDERIYEEGAVDEKLWKQSSKMSHENLPSDEELVDASTIIQDEVTRKMTSTEVLQADNASETVTEIQSLRETEEFNYEEEETRNKLIAHYSKLLPWIYYVLDK